MRKLGAALGVEAHVALQPRRRTRTTCSTACSTTCCARSRCPTRRCRWDDQLWVLGRGFRDAGLAHPGRASHVRGPGRSAPSRATRRSRPPSASCRDAGLDGDAALDAFLSLSSFVLGLRADRHGRHAPGGRRSGHRPVGPAPSWRPRAIPRLIELGEALAQRRHHPRVRAGLQPCCSTASVASSNSSPRPDPSRISGGSAAGSRAPDGSRLGR